MQITSLPATSTLGANDVLACEINGVTYKITGSVLANMMQALGNTLAVSKGGTGLTASPSLQVNLASSSATNILQASPRPGVTGVLALANGGTGVSAANNADLLSKIGITSDWDNYNNWLETAERGTCNASYTGKVLMVTFLTESRVHIENDVIMTLPDRWRPRYNVDIPAYYQNGCCVLRITPDGVMKIWTIQNLSTSGRIYGCFTLVVV